MSTQEDNNKVNVGLKDNSSFYLGVLRFGLGYILITFYHLMNMIGNTEGEFYSFMISDSLIKSIPEGFIVGIILFNYKKILNFKIKK